MQDRARPNRHAFSSIAHFRKPDDTVDRACSSRKFKRELQAALSGRREFHLSRRPALDQAGNQRDFERRSQPLQRSRRNPVPIRLPDHDTGQTDRQHRRSNNPAQPGCGSLISCTAVPNFFDALAQIGARQVTRLESLALRGAQLAVQVIRDEIPFHLPYPAEKSGIGEITLLERFGAYGIRVAQQVRFHWFCRFMPVESHSLQKQITVLDPIPSSAPVSAGLDAVARAGGSDYSAYAPPF